MTKVSKTLIAGAVLLIICLAAGTAWHKQQNGQSLFSYLLNQTRNPQPSGSYITDELADDQIEENLRIDINGQSLTLAVNLSAKKNYVVLPPVTEPVPYRLSGDAVMTNGVTWPITGGGVLLPNSFTRQTMSAGRSLADFFSLWRDVTDQLAPYQAGLTTTLTNKPFSSAEIASAEARLGITLPDFYLNLAHDGRSWQVVKTHRQQPVFRLLAPAELITAADWVEKYVGTPEWKTTRPEEYAQLQKEVVFAVANGEPWIFRGGEYLCEDDRPSVDTGYIDRGEFLSDDTDPFDYYFIGPGYCEDGDTLQFWQALMSRALRDALPEEQFTFVDKNSWVEVTRTGTQPHDTLEGYLQGEWWDAE